MPHRHPPYGQFYLTGNYLDGSPADTVLAQARGPFPIPLIPVQSATAVALAVPAAHTTGAGLQGFPNPATDQPCCIR